MTAVSLVRLMPDSLAPDRVEPLLLGRLGKPYLFQASCASTQRLLDVDLPEGAVAVCDEQREGRGRLGRAWQAPPGTAILCSILLEPPAERRAAELSLAAGIAGAQVVETATGLTAQLKWPNDVMLNRRKVAGILAEVVDDKVVLGIGLNVNQSREELPADARVPPTSLLTTDGVRRDRAPILAELLRALEDVYDVWREGGLALLYAELGSRDFLRGRRVQVNGREGIATGVDREGRLEIDFGGARELLESGEVTYLR